MSLFENMVVRVDVGQRRSSVGALNLARVLAWFPLGIWFSGFEVGSRNYMLFQFRKTLSFLFMHELEEGYPLNLSI